MADPMLNFRCPPELRKKMQEKADRENRKLSDWIRLTLTRTVGLKRKTTFDKAGGRG